MAFTTLTEVKTFLGITGTDDDARITALIPPTEAFIEKLLGICIEKRTGIEEFHDGRARREQILDCRPVIQVTNLNDDPNRVWPTGTDIQASRYTVNKGAGVVALDPFDPDFPITGIPGVFQIGNRNVRVTYDAGYEPADVPPDLKYLVALFIAGALNADDKAGLASETIGRYNYSLGSVETLSASGQAILRAYGFSGSTGAVASTGTLLG